MKSSLINLYKGYFSILKYIFTGRNDGRFLQLNFKLPFVLIILMIIGFTRNLLEVAFMPTGISDLYGGWYSMRPDIVFTMMIGPVYFCFFCAMVFSLFLRFFSKKRYNKELLGFCFHLQILHFLVPFLDIFNSKFNIPYKTQILPYSAAQFLVNPILAMSLGIIVVWLLSGTAVIRFLKDICRISLPKIFLIAFLTFNLLFWPIYIIFPIPNYLFNAFFLTKETDGLFIAEDIVRAYNLFYGYAFFFLFLALSGIIYFRKYFSKSRGKAEF